jgi:hypothetical protein
MNKIAYTSLNDRQKENYNFHKAAAVLADYGFTSIRLSDDWQGADFIAQHIDGETFLKIQLKGRMSIAKKYIEKGLHICFPYEGAWYLFPHDEVMNHLLQTSNIGNTSSWQEEGLYSFKIISKEYLNYFQKFRL